MSRTHPQSGARIWRGCLVLVLLLFAGSSISAGSGNLKGMWRPVRPGDTPAAVLADAGGNGWTRFDTGRLQTFPRTGLGTWVVLHAPPGPPVARVLSMPSPPFGRVTLFAADGSSRSTALDDLQTQTHGHGRLAFSLPASRASSEPILLRLEPSTALAGPMLFRLQSPEAFRHADDLWTVMASASFGVMLAMAFMALCFAAMLRDGTFGWYAGYVASYALVQGVQTGFVFHPLHLAALVPLAIPLGVLATTASVVCAVLFMIRFCDLQRHAPWLRALLISMTVAMVVLALVRSVGLAPLRQVAQTLLNPLLTLTAMLVVIAGLVALLRGSRAAVFFLTGWMPLLVLTALSSAQVDGALADVHWLNQASLAAGAIESLVLSLGLADRALTMRHDRDLARTLADTDALTGVRNRRAWIEAAQEKLRQHDERARTLLFMDLDHFKTLNDELGHAAGDRALKAVAEAIAAELRPEDLFGRFGGEEFVALLDQDDHGNGLIVAQRLCRRVHRLEIPIDVAGHLLTLSIGLAWQRPGDSITSLVERADAAMYAAKAAGRNRVCDERHALATRPVLRGRDPG